MRRGSYAKIRAGNLRPEAHCQRAGIVSCIGSPDSSLTAIGSVRQQRAQHGAGGQEVLHSNAFILRGVCSQTYAARTGMSAHKLTSALGQEWTFQLQSALV